MENGEADVTTEETWDEKEVETSEEEPGGGDEGPEEVPTDTPPETLEEEEEISVPKIPPIQPDAPKKEHVNVVFIGHVGQCIRRPRLWFSKGMNMNDVFPMLVAAVATGSNVNMSHAGQQDVAATRSL